MKTTKETAKDINESWWKSTEHIQITLERKLKKFESEIRKDQDKITRHACAEIAVNEGSDECGFYTLHSSTSIHQAIMNTKAIKEEL